MLNTFSSTIKEPIRKILWKKLEEIFEKISQGWPKTIFRQYETVAKLGYLEKIGHFDEILALSEPAYAGRPIGGERKPKGRKMAIFNKWPSYAMVSIWLRPTLRKISKRFLDFSRVFCG